MIRTASNDGKTEFIQFAALKASLGYTFPPPHRAMQSKMNSVVQAAILSVSKVDDVAATAMADARISAVGRQEMLAPILATTDAALTKALQHVADEAQRIEAVRAALYAPPQLDKADAVGAVLDSEIRDGVKKLSGNEKQAMFEGMKDGTQERVLDALLRDPFDSVWRVFARELHNVRVEQKNADAVAELETASDLREWALVAVQGLIRGLANSPARSAVSLR